MAEDDEDTSAELQACLVLCGLSPQQRQAVLDEGYITLQDFAMNRYADITEFTEKLNSLLPAHCGGGSGSVHFRPMDVIQLKGFLFWLKDRRRRGLPLTAHNNEFNAEQLKKAIADYEVERHPPQPPAKAPDKFQPFTPGGWHRFTQQLETYLSSLRGLSGVPLIYVIRKEPEAGEQLPDEEPQRLIWQAPLHGFYFNHDNHMVYRILCSAIIGTGGWPWMSDVKHQDSRLAMMKLRQHYDYPLRRRHYELYDEHYDGGRRRKRHRSRRKRQRMF